MRTTAILNQKGGVAKTVTAVNMAAILAADYNMEVLVVDGDAQANATEFFGGLQRGACTLADLLRRHNDGQTIQASNFDGVALLGADDSLMDLDLSAVKSKEADVTSLARLVEQYKRRFDYVLIDCPPAFNAASAAALLAADDVIIPIKMDSFALRGMANLMRQIKNMQAINPSLRVAGLLPTMVYKSDAITQAMDALQSSGLQVFPAIRRSNKTDDSTFAQAPLIQSSPKSAACIDYRRFVRTYLKGGARRG